MIPEEKKGDIMRKIPVLILIMACNLRNAAAKDTSGYNCFTILVGRNASADGSVFIAHNEDNPGDAFVDLHKVPRIDHAPGEMQKFTFYSDFPFSFKPKQKILIQDLMRILENHYEGTEFEMNPAYAHGCPHSNTTTTRICNSMTDFGSVIRLPAAVGNVMWVAPRNPCCQPFIPWYYGIERISPDYEKATIDEALANYNSKNRGYRSLYPDHAYYVFDAFMLQTDSSYAETIGSVRRWKRSFEEDVFRATEKNEKEIAGITEPDPVKAGRMLTELSNRFAGKALAETKKKLKK